MLVSMKEILEDARKNHYALPAFDISNYDMMKAVLEACEEERSPALLMALGVDLEGRDMNLLASMIRFASDYFKIPVCLHLDHATDFTLIQRAVEAGFSSVMYDGSTLDPKTNVENTIAAVVLALISLVYGILLIKNTWEDKEIGKWKKTKQYIWVLLCFGYVAVIIWFQLYDFVHI